MSQAVASRVPRTVRHGFGHGPRPLGVVGPLVGAGSSDSRSSVAVAISRASAVSVQKPETSTIAITSETHRTLSPNRRVATAHATKTKLRTRVVCSGNICPIAENSRGTTVTGPVLPVGAVRSPRSTATRLRGRRLAGFRPAGPARVSRRGARRTVRRHHDPRTDDTRRRASGDHQSGTPSSRWPKARSLILLQLRPRCSTPVIGVPAATAQRCAVGAFPWSRLPRSGRAS